MNDKELDELLTKVAQSEAHGDVIALLLCGMRLLKYPNELPGYSATQQSDRDRAYEKGMECIDTAKELIITRAGRMPTGMEQRQNG